MKTDAQRKARNNYRKKIRHFALECYPDDGDIIAKLEEEKQRGGYNAYIKELIRRDIAADKFTNKLASEHEPTEAKEALK